MRFLGASDIPFINMESSYTGVFILWKVIEPFT